MSETAPRRGFRLSAFSAGFAAGLATVAGMVLLLLAAPGWLGLRPSFNLEVLANGADISRAGGTRVVLEDDAGRPIVAATCNGPCDDLGYRLITSDSAHLITVLNARGEQIAHGSDGYVDRFSVARVRVAGAPRLTVAQEYLDPRDPRSPAAGQTPAATSPTH